MLLQALLVIIYYIKYNKNIRIVKNIDIGFMLVVFIILIRTRIIKPITTINN